MSLLPNYNSIYQALMSKYYWGSILSNNVSLLYNNEQLLKSACYNLRIRMLGI